MTGDGFASIDFGSSGSQVATLTVTGQTGIATGDHVECWVMGNGTTVDHNAYEHAIVPLTIKCTAIVAATSFTVLGVSPIHLTGLFKFRWIWSTITP